MSHKFYCPRCHGRLDVHEYVVLAAKAKDKNMGLLLLSPHLGNYDIWHNDEFQFKEGELVKFFCPVCHLDLTANEHHDHLAKIYMRDSEEHTHSVFFSTIKGEQATYTVKEDVIEHFGPHYEQYVKYLSHKMM